MNYQATHRLDYQMKIHKIVHKQIRQDSKNKKGEDINIAAELGLMRNNSMDKKFKSKLRSTQVRRALNAANRIKGLSEMEPKKPFLHAKTKSVPIFKRKAKELENEIIEVKDLDVETPTVVGKKFVDKALHNFESQAVLENQNPNFEMTHRVEQALKLKKIDKYVKNYRKGTRKQRMITRSEYPPQTSPDRFTIQACSHGSLPYQITMY